MKSILVDFDGNIQNITEVGEEFEVYEGDNNLKWIQVDDSVDMGMKVRNGVPVDAGTLFDSSSREKAEIERKVQYGDVGAQLDLLYKDLKKGTTTFVEFIDEIKNNTLRPGDLPDDDSIEYSEPERPCWETK